MKPDFGKNDSFETRHAAATDGKSPHFLPPPKRDDPSRRNVAVRKYLSSYE